MSVCASTSCTPETSGSSVTAEIYGSSAWGVGCAEPGYLHVIARLLRLQCTTLVRPETSLQRGALWVNCRRRAMLNRPCICPLERRLELQRSRSSCFHCSGAAVRKKKSALRVMRDVNVIPTRRVTATWPVTPTSVSTLTRSPVGAVEVTAVAKPKAVRRMANRAAAAGRASQTARMTTAPVQGLGRTEPGTRRVPRHPTRRVRVRQVARRIPTNPPDPSFRAILLSTARCIDMVSCGSLGLSSSAKVVIPYSSRV